MTTLPACLSDLSPIFNSLLVSIFPHVGRLALDAGISSWSQVRQATIYTGLDEDRVIETKCRLIADTLAYLFSFEEIEDPRRGMEMEASYPSFSHPRRGMEMEASYPSFSHPNRPSGWWIRIHGRNHFNQATSVGHAFVVVMTGDECAWLIDGYIGCRSLTQRQINLVDLQEILSSLEENYDPDLWMMLTGCQEEEIPTHCKLIIKEYTYNDGEIDQRYSELIAQNPDLRYGHKKE